jgi:hypothetical protein
MSTKRRKTLLAVGGLLFGIACGVGISTMQSGGDTPTALITEHRPLVGSPTRHLGEDCTTYGGSGCISGVCLHAKPARNRGFFCSRRCARRADCPVGWQCPQIYPGPHGHFCVPPSNWTASVAYLPDGGTQ